MARSAASHPYGYLSLDREVRVPGPDAAGGDAQRACERVVSALGGAGIRCTRQNGLQVHSWLLRLFNPSPDWVEKSTLYHQAAYADPRNFPAGVAPVSNDFAETLWFTPPVSDPENGVWWIDNKPHCALPVERLRTPPEPGTITGEQARGEKKSTR